MTWWELITTCMSLDQEGPVTVAVLAERTNASPAALRRLIRSLAPLGVFTTDGDQVSITPLGATLGETPVVAARRCQGRNAVALLAIQRVTALTTLGQAVFTRPPSMRKSAPTMLAACGEAR